jgi:hypothetical protein
MKVAFEEGYREKGGGGQECTIFGHGKVKAQGMLSFYHFFSVSLWFQGEPSKGRGKFDLPTILECSRDL